MLMSNAFLSISYNFGNHHLTSLLWSGSTVSKSEQSENFMLLGFLGSTFSASSSLERRDIFSFRSWSSVRPTKSLELGLLLVGLLPDPPGLLLKDGPGLLGDLGLLGLDFAGPGISLDIKDDNILSCPKILSLTSLEFATFPDSGPRCSRSCLSPLSHHHNPLTRT